MSVDNRSTTIRKRTKNRLRMLTLLKSEVKISNIAKLWWNSPGNGRFTTDLQGCIQTYDMTLPEMSPNVLNILHSYILHGASAEQYDLGIKALDSPSPTNHFFITNSSYAGTFGHTVLYSPSTHHRIFSFL